VGGKSSSGKEDDWRKSDPWKSDGKKGKDKGWSGGDDQQSAWGGGSEKSGWSTTGSAARWKAPNKNEERMVQCQVCQEPAPQKSLTLVYNTSRKSYYRGTVDFGFCGNHTCGTVLQARVDSASLWEGCNTVLEPLLKNGQSHMDKDDKEIVDNMPILVTLRENIGWYADKIKERNAGV
jgi:hypothetical protein